MIEIGPHLPIIAEIKVAPFYHSQYWVSLFWFCCICCFNCSVFGGTCYPNYTVLYAGCSGL